MRGRPSATCAARARRAARVCTPAFAPLCGLACRAASLLPSIRLEVSATRRDLAGGDAVLPGTDKAAMLVFKHNLYSGGAEIARARQAGHRAAESQLEEENLRRQIERAVVQTIADMFDVINNLIR